MHPWFETLAEQTGKYIDLYGSAEFSPIEFEGLRTITAEVRQQALDCPDTWRVTTGRQTHPERKEILRDVNRTNFLKLLDDLRESWIRHHRQARASSASETNKNNGANKHPKSRLAVVSAYPDSVN